MSLSAIASSRSGLLAAERRLAVAASNVASAGVTGTPPDASGRSSAYRPLDVRQSADGAGRVRSEVVPRANGVKVQFDPDSPDADAAGRVGAPAVDMVAELTDVLQARIGYAASAKVMKVADGLLKTTTDMLA